MTSPKLRNDPSRKQETYVSSRKDRESATDYNILYSRSVEGNLAELLGAPHYSYRFAEEKFTRAMRENGYGPNYLKMPEYYASIHALPLALSSPVPLFHLIFRSTEQMRLLKFAWNIGCFAWEFEVLKDDTRIGEHPFLNQRRMLALCDEIWAPCKYTVSVLNAHGLCNSFLIPAPISLPSEQPASKLDALASIGDILVAPLYYNFLQSRDQNKEIVGGRSCTLVEYLAQRLRDAADIKIYLTILNPEDFRKNLDAMLRAFEYFSRGRDDVVLLVKILTSGSRFSLLDAVCDIIPNKLDSGTGVCSSNIVFFNEYLTEESMNCLYFMADFYVCASICEAQNLPLLEAMAQGVVPITTANTAMADYITDDNAITIRDHIIPNDCIHLAGTIAGKPFNIRKSRVDDIYKALLRSTDLSLAQYDEMASCARESVRQGFSEEVILTRIRERFDATRSSAMAKLAHLEQRA